MKSIKKLFFTISIVCLIMACSKDDGDSSLTLSNENQIISFQFLAGNNALSDNVTGTINENTKTITATVPYGTNTGVLIPEIGISTAASYSPGGAQDFTSPVIYTVTAADSSTENYTVNVTITENDAKQITSFLFLADDNAALSENVTGIINETEKTVSIGVPHGTDLTALLPDIVTSVEASYSPEGTQDFTNPIIYTVTAENGTTENYNVTVTVSEKSILTILFNENPGNTLGWDITADISTWGGVTTNSSGNITELNLGDKNITTIPAEIGQLTHLTYLSLHNNQLSAIPSEIGYLTNLEQLYLNGNQFTVVPAEIWQLINLSALALSQNEFTVIPAEIGQLTKLSQLYLEDNQLTSFPTEIGQLVNLEFLRINNNQLTSLPPEMGQLVSLRRLNISENQLTSLPAEVWQLSNLEHLLIRENLLTSISSNMGELTNLQHLLIDGNQIITIPPEIGQLINLELLYINKNDLTSIPEEIGLLTNLQTLSLTENSITSIPQAVCDLETDHGTTIEKDAGVTCTP